ncbi:SRPBCC domain-containing protein [Paenibacillus sp. MWE-103]|uniref:SRPBCC domain-containing protein n=1 Tax=Paenibacillus artemisiicola TaxID=1172618 RepID=A0ABS3WDF5_9BACL|nr:SRPBCC domain-containing protein [Paenibacillus artemisiicola]MBO7746126.1 SRPBCC domain-containing protein [Paenibacillus artemisiicola]
MVGQTYRQALRETTGTAWEDWLARLQGDVDPAWSHERIRAHIRDNYAVGDDWAEWLALSYGQLLGRIPVGVTKDAGVQIGLRRTLRAPKEQAWAYLTSADGLPKWIGAGADMRWEAGETYETEEGGGGTIAVAEPKRKLRLTWRRPAWEPASRLQIYTLEAKSGGTTVSVHQEMLEDVYVREVMRRFWEDKLQAMKRALDA